MSAERDERGRFIKGNKASPGRPTKRTEKDYLAITMEAVTPEAWQGVARRALYDAIKGDAKARRWLSDYVLGRPPQILELRGTDAHLLAQLIDALKAADMSPGEMFAALIAELANAEVGEGESSE